MGFTSGVFALKTYHTYSTDLARSVPRRTTTASTNRYGMDQIKTAPKFSVSCFRGRNFGPCLCFFIGCFVQIRVMILRCVALDVAYASIVWFQVPPASITTFTVLTITENAATVVPGERRRTHVCTARKSIHD